MKEHRFLHEAGQRVRTEIAVFAIPVHQPDQLGKPLPEEWFLQQLGKMRTSLVEPYYADIGVDGHPSGDAPKTSTKRVVIVAEDESVLLAYDPHSDGDFTLIFKSAITSGVSPVRGGAVDCFLSR